MCTFSKPVKHVTKTKIFVTWAPPSMDASCVGTASRATITAAHPRSEACGAEDGCMRPPSAAHMRQLTVYSNQVQLAGCGSPTAMVLPVPVAPATQRAGDTLCGITVHAMPACTDKFFDVLETILDVRPADSYGRGAWRPKSTLSIQRAGAYTYTVVPSIDDFARLRNEVFGVPTGSELHSMLSAYYSRDFAFLVCIIDASATYRPFAYEHDALPNGDLFVPTRHYHPRQTGCLGCFPWSDTTTALEADADWDHKIWSCGVDPRDEDAGWFVGKHESELQPPAGRNPQLSSAMEAAGVAGLPFDLSTAKVTAMRMKHVQGSHPNEDTVFRRPRP
jgi:hypothetical protein